VKVVRQLPKEAQSRRVWGHASQEIFGLSCFKDMSAWVVFKWHWWDWTSSYLAGNNHMTG